MCGELSSFQAEGLQQRAAGGEQQRQPRATDFDVSAAALFQVACSGIDFLMVSSPLCMPRGATRGFHLERIILRLHMSLCSHDSSVVTDVVRIGCSCALLHV